MSATKGFGSPTLTEQQKAQIAALVPSGQNGSAATITVGSVTTGSAGSQASVSNSGSPSAAKLDFTIPRGNDGTNGSAASVSIGTVSAGAAGSNAAVTNSGSPTSAVFNFTIPRGSNGNDGAAATVTVGSVTTGAPGSSAAVVNSGTTNAAKLDFSIPRGADGSNGTNATALVGSVTLAETALITLALAVRRVTVALAGTVTAGSYIAIPTGALPAGYSIQDCYCSTAGQITVGILVPVLSVAGSYSIPVKIYRLN